MLFQLCTAACTLAAARTALAVSNATLAATRSGAAAVGMSGSIDSSEAQQAANDALFPWLQSRGANVSAMELFTNAAEGGRRGVRARRALRKGELMLTVPHSHLIDAALARASEPFGTRFLTPALARLSPVSSQASVSDCHVLALFLAFERGVNRAHSALGPFLDVLPHDFSHMPSNWGPTDARLQLLQTLPSAGTTYKALVADFRGVEHSALAALAADIFSAVSASAEFKGSPGASVQVQQELLLWGLDIVQSRSWGGMWKEPGVKVPGTCFLLPGVEMMNHAADGVGLLMVKNHEEGDYVGWGLVAHKDLTAGEEAFYSYSSSSSGGWTGGVAQPRRCHVQELCAHGFLDTSPLGGLDCFSIVFDLGLPSDEELPAGTVPAPLLAAKRAMLRPVETSAFTLEFSGSGSGDNCKTLADWDTPAALAAFEFPPGLLATLRAHVLQEAEAPLVLTALAELGRKGVTTVAMDWARAVLPLETELRVLRTLRHILGELRDTKFVATLEEDAAAVARGVARGEPMVGELAVLRMRLGEQVVIHLAQKKVAQLWMGLLDERPPA